MNRRRLGFAMNAGREIEAAVFAEDGVGRLAGRAASGQFAACAGASAIIAPHTEQKSFWRIACPFGQRFCGIGQALWMRGWSWSSLVSSAMTDPLSLPSGFLAHPALLFVIHVSHLPQELHGCFIARLVGRQQPSRPSPRRRHRGRGALRPFSWMHSPVGAFRYSGRHGACLVDFKQ